MPKKVEIVKTPGFVIEVPQERRKTFFVRPKTQLEYWAFRNRPRVFVQEKLIFTFGGKPVAEAVVVRVEAPGKGEGEYKDWHKVYWKPTTFRRFRTAATRLYHGTRRRFKPGDILTPQPSGYAHDPETAKIESIMEKHRPENSLSRKNSVYMVEDPDDVVKAGGYEDYIYEVEPIGKVEKSGLGWYGDVSVYGEYQPDDPDVIQAAKNYWAGIPHELKLWEYRAPKAKVVGLVSSEAHRAALLKSSKVNIDTYIHGRCEVFALALNKALGYKMRFIWDTDPSGSGEYDEPEALVHAFCVRPNGTLVDASGTITEEEAETSHGDCHEADHREIGVAELGKLWEKKYLNPPKAGEVESLAAFIKKNPDVYQSGKRKLGAAFRLPTFEEVVDKKTDTNGEFDLGSSDMDVWNERNLTNMREYYDEVAPKLAALKFPLTVYRCYALREGDKVDYKQLGGSWSLDSRSAYLTVHDMFDDSEYESYPVVVGTVAGPGSVDWLNTMRAWMTLPEEREIRLKGGAKVKVRGKMRTAGGEIEKAPPAAELLKPEFLSDEEFSRIRDYLNALEWMGRNPWYPEKYPWFGIRLYSDRWVASNDLSKEQLAEGEDLASLKRYLSKYNLKELRTPRYKTIDQPTSGIVRRTSADKVLDVGGGDEYWAGEGDAASGILPVCPQKGTVCLAWRSRHVMTSDCWGTIGGAVQEGLSPSKSARRELAEETGYSGGITLHPAYTFTDRGFSYHNFVGVVGSEFGMSPKPYTEEQIAKLKENNAAKYQYTPGWETDRIVWVPYAEVVKDMREYPADYHPGLLKLFANSADVIERALKVEDAPEEGKTGTKVAWQVIEHEYEPEGSYLFGGILESTADLDDWLSERDQPTMDGRRYRRLWNLLKGKKIAVIDDMKAEERGKGVGTKMVADFLAEAQSKGCDAIMLHAGIHEKQQKGFDLVAWYKSKGFKDLGKLGEMPLMVKWLKAPGKTAEVSPNAPPPDASRLPCPSGKRKFYDEMSAIGPHRGPAGLKGLPFRAYVCPKCGWWHVTSKPQRQPVMAAGQQHMFPSSQDARFRQWFDGSKVVDKRGNPMPVYHGTRSSVDFEEFSVEGPPYVEEQEGTTSSESSGDATAFLGAHFAEEPGVANMFAEGKGWTSTRYEGEAPKPRVVKVYLRITNPKDFGSEFNLREYINQGKIADDDVLQLAMQNDGILYWEEDEATQKAVEDWYAKYEGDAGFRSDQNTYIFEQHHREEGDEEVINGAAYDLAMQAKSRLRTAGHDGVRYKNAVEGGNAWIAFDAAQIKSAYAQQFDRKDPRFTASKRAEDAQYHMEEGCGIWAVDFARENGGEIYVLSTDGGEAWSEDIPYEVTHAFVKKNGKTYDARGERRIEAMAADFNADSYSVKGPWSPEMFEDKFMGATDDKPLYGKRAAGPEWPKLPPTDEWVKRARLFLKDKWAQRHKELGREGDPSLEGACKFASLFALKLFGGKMVGNPAHQVLRLPMGRLLDLAGGEVPINFTHDKEFWGNPEHAESMASCEPRVAAWVDEFMAHYRNDVFIQQMDRVQPSGKKQSSEDALYAHLDTQNEVAFSVIDEYRKHKGDRSYRMRWDVVPAGRLKKIWADYMKLGFVRDEAGINRIAQIILTNIAKIEVNNILSGHSEQNPEQYASDLFDEQFPEDYFNDDNSFFDDDNGAWRISDYAADKLGNGAVALRDAKSAEDKLQAIDYILSVTHQRSDLSSWFVEGGRGTLNQIYGKGKSGPVEAEPMERKHGPAKKTVNPELPKEADWRSRVLLPGALALGLGAPPATHPGNLSPQQVEQRQHEMSESQSRAEQQKRMDALVAAISRAEGADPSLNNPGNIVDFNTGKIKAFGSWEEGRGALEDQLNEIAEGSHRFISPDMTLRDAGMVYSNGDPNWARNVSLIMHVPQTIPMGELIRGAALRAESAPAYDKTSAWVKRAAGFAFKSFPKLWHVGTMNPKDKRDDSYEGAGLSVSVNPDEWQQIAKIGGDLWELTKKGNRFVNFHRLSKAQRKQIAAWGVKNGYALSAELWRHSWFDDELDDWRYSDYANKQEAEAEFGGYGGGENEKVEPVKGGMTATPKLSQKSKRGRIDPLEVMDLLVAAYAEDELECDGVWWDDDLDPDNLSAPRGVIFPSKLASWKRRRVQSAKVASSVQEFYHGTTWEAADKIAKEGLKRHPWKIGPGSFVWASIIPGQGHQYGLSSSGEDQYAVVTFLWDYDKTEPDPEHGAATGEDYSDVFRRIPANVPRTAIQSIEYFDWDGNLVKTASKTYLYHGTYKSNLPDIRKHGLGGAERRAYSISKKGLVYLASDSHAAYLWALGADNAPVDKDGNVDAGQIVVLQIDESKLDQSKLDFDENIRLPEDCPECSTPVLRRDDPNYVCQWEECNYRFEGDVSYQYAGVVPPNAIKIAKTAARNPQQ